MSDKRWKKTERVKCTSLGGSRTGPRGFGLPDCVGIKFALEVKSYERFTFLTKDWEQAVENAARVGLPPVLAVKEAGRNPRDCVQMYEGDFARLRIAARQSPHPFDPESCTLIRAAWSQFERLYRAAYIDNEESIG